MNILIEERLEPPKLNTSLLTGLAAMLWPEVAGDPDGAEEDLTAGTPPGVLPNAIALQRARAGNAASAVSAGAAAECGDTKPTVATPAVPKVTMPSFKLDLSAVRALPPPVLDTSPSDDEDDRTQDGRTDDGGLAPKEGELAPKEGEGGVSSLAGVEHAVGGDLCDGDPLESPRCANDSRPLTVRGPPTHKHELLFAVGPETLGDGHCRFCWRPGGGMVAAASIVGAQLVVHLFGRHGRLLARHAFKSSAHATWIEWDASGSTLGLLQSGVGIWLWETAADGSVGSFGSPVALASQLTQGATFCKWSRKHPPYPPVPPSTIIYSMVYHHMYSPSVLPH